MNNNEAMKVLDRMKRELEGKAEAVKRRGWNEAQKTKTIADYRHRICGLTVALCALQAAKDAEATGQPEAVPESPEGQAARFGAEWHRY